jgi:DNA invertase Pin-like site-specific DNA recombinase
MSALARRSGIEERPEKIHPRHLEQTAIVYIRQSSMQQVHRNQESTQIQYGLVGVAEQLGWARDRIAVIDDDLGHSGASAVGRAGFQRLLAEVALDHVGLIVGVEMSRLARSNTDWHQLLELCARFGTLIADLDGLYDPARYNDRLLLGLKGTMSEAELHILRQRLWQGKLHKARRGELAMPVPTGYLRTLAGEVTLDPDEEVQAAVRCVFDAFERCGTIHSTLRALVRQGVHLGVRRRTRPALGRLEWHGVHRGMLINMLRHPIYAGAYAYGRRRLDPRRQQPGRPATGRITVLAAAQWHVCLRDRLPAYITWEQYERTQVRLKTNRERHPAASAGSGSALLAGLVVCGRCGYRMSVQYSKSANGRRYARYVCGHLAATRGAAVCCGLSAPPVDAEIAALALRAMEPAALEVSLQVSEAIEHERRQSDALWQKRLQRARYEAERAERQYHAVEPENRLVARTLERAWEEKLHAERTLGEEHRRARAREPRYLTEQEREVIRSLARDLPTLWAAPTTTPADRKHVLRLLLERVVITIEQASEWVTVAVHWAGGQETHTRMRRPVGKLLAMSRHRELLAELRRLRREGYTAGQMAARLNATGWTTPTQRNGFTERLVRVMLLRYGSVPKGPKRPPSDDPAEWWLADLAKALDMPVVTLYGWLHRGWLKTRRVNGQWVVHADAAERVRLAQLRRQHPPRPRPLSTQKRT